MTRFLFEQEVKDKVSKRFIAKTKQGEGPKPHLIDPVVYSQHASYCENGQRIWGFKTETGRDKFVEDYKNSAKAE